MNWVDDGTSSVLTVDGQVIATVRSLHKGWRVNQVPTRFPTLELAKQYAETLLEAA